MEFLVRGLFEALNLILKADGEVIEITLRSLAVSSSAVFLAALIGIPLGALLALGRFRGRRLARALVNTFMGLPPVVVGLVVVLVLARRGPFGSLELLYSTAGMVLAQFVIAMPIVAGLTVSALNGLDPGLRLQLLALGAESMTVARALLWECRQGVYAAVMAAFGRVCAEVGAVMMVGGNIRHSTRVLTTATVLEARQGNYERAIALGVILLTLAFVINVLLTSLQEKARAK